jgi:hypothetical protein
MTEERKGGVAKAEWLERYGSIFQGLGWTPFQAEREALAAWDESEGDMGPNEAANTTISYMREDGA